MCHENGLNRPIECQENRSLVQIMNQKSQALDKTLSGKWAIKPESILGK